MAIKVKAIAHEALNVHDMDKALEFYTGVLGFPLAFDIQRNGEPWINYVKVAPRTFLELFYVGPNDDYPADNPSYHHICLGVDDIFAIEKVLDEKGWPIDTRPKLAGDKNWQMWTADPDGNKLEIMQIMPDSPQANA